MQSTPEIEALNKGVLAQLNAEIAAAGLDPKKFAKKMGADYNTLRRYLNGEREIPMHVFWAALKELGLETADFMSEAQRRARKLAQQESDLPD